MSARALDQEVLQRLAKATDFAALTGTALYLTLLAARSSYQVSATGFFTLLIVFAILIALRGLKLYALSAWSNGLATALKSSVVACAIGLVAYAGSSLVRLDLPPGWAITWIATVTIYFAVTRAAAQLWIRSRVAAGSFQRRIAIVGGGAAAEDAIALIENSGELDASIMGLFDDRYDSRSPDSIRKHRKLGKIADLSEFSRKNHVDLVIVAIPMTAERRLLQILKRLWELPVDIRISAAAAELKLSPRAYSYLGKLPLLNVFERPLSAWDSFLKSAMDRTIALCAIIALAPVMLAVAIAVRLESKGPIIFKQKRYGFNNELVEVSKFRSMYADMSDTAAAKLVTKGDARVTKVGRFIRKTSLDELPQLFNVIMGTLSLVGARPHATQAKAAGTVYDEVVDGYFARHKVKPGITGWAQINGWRGETDTREKLVQRVKHDLDYIGRWSLGLDLAILARTPLVLFRSESAY